MKQMIDRHELLNFLIVIKSHEKENLEGIFMEIV